MAKPRDRRLRCWVFLPAALLLAIAGRANVRAGELTMDDLARMCPAQLDQLYQASCAAPLPSGKINGRALIRPGTSFAVPRSRAARLLWQGKVFHPEDCTAINRFFGMRVIRGKLYYASSWMDGRPSLILDYQDTSLLYGPYRDEIRQVAPGLFLGLMYERACPQPNFKLYFALDIRH
jgi:hypothetical protein